MPENMLPLLLSWALLSGISSTFAATNPTAQDTYNISKPTTITKPNCRSKCGNVTVPYPFGIGSGCGINKWFELNCTDASGSPPRLLLQGLGLHVFSGRGTDPYNGEFDNVSSTQVYGISDGRVRVANILLSSSCYSRNGKVTVKGNAYSNLTGTPYTYSDLNKLTVVGCDDDATLVGMGHTWMNNGCSAVCTRAKDVVAGKCSGTGCCESKLGKGQNIYYTIMMSAGRNNRKDVVSFNPCGYFFVGEQGLFVFRGASDLSDPDLMQRVWDTVPTVLDWWIGNSSCEEAKKSGENYACRENSLCFDSDTGLGGYRCSCDSGYQGNPYLAPGCTDINECLDPNANDCEKTCINTLGSFNCSCPQGQFGDGRKNGQGCNPYSPEFPVIEVALGAGFGLLTVVAAVTWLYFFVKKRKLLKLRAKFFHRNGGSLLQQHLSSKEGFAEPTKIFTAHELEKATNNYADDRILGRGGYGTVYKGVLPDKSVVAIKKSRGIDESQIDQFINEVVILTQVNHRNVVKYLGCCLESEAPLLVYEYILNRTLFEHIQEKSSWLSWENRLRIASEAAGALSYLHSSASTPIIHRDVKSANILLDEHYIAKISDFGASRLIPLDQTKVTTMVIGTIGYLDPEYYRTSQLTEKSDVYSFGVVLVELLTGGMPVDMETREDQLNLSAHFITSMKEGRLFQILEPRVVREGSFEQLQEIAELIVRCFELNREDRPTMKEVAMELEALRKLTKNSWSHQCDSEELVGLMTGKGSNDLYTVSTSPDSTGEFSASGQHISSSNASQV